MSDIIIPTSIPPQFKEKYGSIATMIVPFCLRYWDQEYSDLCLHALQKLCRKRTAPISTGRDNMWAAGIVYAIAQNCGLIGNQSRMFAGPRKYKITGDQVSEFFGVSKNGAAEKAKIIKAELKITPGAEEWAVPSMYESVQAKKAFMKIMKNL